MAPACWLLGRNAFALKRNVHLYNSKGESNHFYGVITLSRNHWCLGVQIPSEREDEMHSNMPGETK
jgi:hypothetical protein